MHRGSVVKSWTGVTVKWHLTFAACRITFPLVIQSFRNRVLPGYFEAADPSRLGVPNIVRE